MKSTVPGRPGLVVVVHDLREPLVVHDAVHVLRLGLGVGVEVAVVVVADVLLVQPRQAGQTTVSSGPWLAHVPVGDQVHAVGIGVDEQDDHVVENAQRLLVLGGDELVDASRSAPGHRAISLACMPPSIQTTALPSAASFGRLGRADALGQGQAAGDLPDNGPACRGWPAR